MEITLRIKKVSPGLFFKTLVAPLLFTLLPGATAIADSTSLPFAYEKHIPFVRVQPMNSSQPSMCFILDTGASTTVVGSTTIDRLKLGYYKSSHPVNDFATASTCGLGNSPAEYILGLRATCGGLPLRPIAARTDITNMGLSSGRQVDGLLGTDFLRNKILTIDTANHTLRLEQAPGADNGLTRTIDNIPIDRNDAVFVKINTPAFPRPLVFLVDTGATHCLIDSKVAKRMNLSHGTEHIVNVVGGEKVAYSANNFVGSFDGHPMPSQVFAVDLSQASWSLPRHIDGILGMNFMENYTVKINFNTHQMQVLPSQVANRGIAAR